MSNFSYLMALNTLAGRSYNDLTQYPVFPWILCDYESETLDLTDPGVYRDLSKPMGAIGPERAEQYQERFECWDDPTGDVPPFHYGTHYSSAAGTLYYLFRLEPFSTMALNFQGGKFDHADRLFYDIGHSWRSASSAGGMSDVKEIVPEFFYLPDFLKNNSRFDIGSFQDGRWLDEVSLPKWAKSDPRRFIKLHQMALESPHVSANLHHWIDLIFGYKQRGEAAISAQNVFYHLTYAGAVDINAIEDPFEQECVIAQINNFGQTPAQLFTKPHGARKVIRPPPNICTHPQLIKLDSSKKSGKDSIIYKNVLGEGAPEPVGSVMECGSRVTALSHTQAFCPKKFSKYLHWGYADDSLRFSVSVKTPRHGANDLVALHEGLHDGHITAAHVTADGSLLATGGSDSVLSIARIHRIHKYKCLTDLRSLCAHNSPITIITSSVNWSVFVTAAGNEVMFWEMDKLILSHRLPAFPRPVTAIAIDEGPPPTTILSLPVSLSPLFLRSVLVVRYNFCSLIYNVCSSCVLC